MIRRMFFPVFVAALFATRYQSGADDQPAKPKELRAGIIGLDTSHAVAFTAMLNKPDAKDHVPGCRVVAAYPKGSPDIESSVSRVPGYTKQVQELGVEIVDSIDKLLEKVDVVFLETNDGRPHLEQVLPVLKAGKRVFIDKPIAGSLADAVAIFDAAEQCKVPLFSCSSLRYAEGAQTLRAGKIGNILGCDAYSPCSLESTHPDLFWYGIHGVESLFTVMGTGCDKVTRVSTPGIDLAVGTWKGGRVGTFRGIRDGSSGYGGTAFGAKGIDQIGPYGGYRPLLVEIVKFFQGGETPVSKEETLEILKKAADAGLVHGISNYEEKPDTICNCDPTYCTMFRPYHLLGHDKSMDASNYRVKVSPEKCKACALCVKRCPMDAIQLKVFAEATNKFGKAVHVDTDICIGCGVCVHKCPTEAIVLERQAETTRPPKSVREWSQLYLSDVLAAEERQK